MTKGDLVVVSNPDPEFERRLEAVMREHARSVEIALGNMYDYAVCQMMNGGPAGFAGTGRLSNRDPEPARWPTGEKLTSKSLERLATVDYSHIEERVLAHYANIELAKPYIPQEEPPMKKVLSAGIAAVAATAAAQGYSVVHVETENVIPNHVCIDDTSPYFWRHFRHLGVKIDGEERKGDVHEFNVAQGWAMVRQRNDIGQFKIDPDNTRRFLLTRVQGKIEPYLKSPIPVKNGPDEGDLARLAAASEKRARKAAKLKAQFNGM